MQPSIIRAGVYVSDQATGVAIAYTLSDDVPAIRCSGETRGKAIADLVAELKSVGYGGCELRVSNGPHFAPTFKSGSAA